MTDYIAKSAAVSPCGTYRYSLTREWRLNNGQARWAMLYDEECEPALDGDGEHLGDPLACVFVMLNPSTADGEQDDPTIRRCVAFAKRQNFDKLIVVNLFAWRATDPRTLLSVSPERDPVGDRNQSYVNAALGDAGMIVCAWGAHGGHLGQDETMLGWIDAGNWHEAPVVCLGTTKCGFPRHPLYLPGDAQPVPYSGRKAA